MDRETSASNQLNHQVIDVTKKSPNKG
jgi:hypothetical protein